MPTDIYFAGGSVWLGVEEAPGQVAEAFNSARGLSFALTARGGGEAVYVNPGMVAFWLVPEHGPEPDASQEGQPSGVRRQAVTDLWGNPLRRTRRS